MLLVKITVFFSLIFLIYLLFVRLHYSSLSNSIKLRYKVNNFCQKDIWDPEIINLIILGFSSFIEVILILCSAFYLIFLR